MGGHVYQNCRYNPNNVGINVTQNKKCREKNNPSQKKGGRGIDYERSEFGSVFEYPP